MARVFTIFGTDLLSKTLLAWYRSGMDVEQQYAKTKHLSRSYTCDRYLLVYISRAGAFAIGHFTSYGRRYPYDENKR